MSTAESKPIHQDPVWLHEKYRVEGLTQTEMAQLAGVSQFTIHHQMKKHGIKARSSYTNEELLDDLRRVASELGEAPNTADYKTHGEYGHSTIIDRWGAWSCALKAAGLPRRD